MRGEALWSDGPLRGSGGRLRRGPGGRPRAGAGAPRPRAISRRAQPLDDALIDARGGRPRAARSRVPSHAGVGIHERLRRFDEAAASLASYIDLLPNSERSEKAGWARAEIRFLRSFKGRTPFQVDALPPPASSPCRSGSAATRSPSSGQGQRRTAGVRPRYRRRAHRSSRWTSRGGAA